MTRDVLISISGIQLLDGEQNDAEIITVGDYFHKNGKHYILYDEVLEGQSGVIKNTIKISPDGLDIIKKGVANVHMVFEKDKKNLSCYATPFGEMMVGVNTNQIIIDENDDVLKVKVKYTLDINYQKISECDITMDIQSKGKAGLHLLS